MTNRLKKMKWAHRKRRSHRGLAPFKVNKLVRCSLDWIVLLSSGFNCFDYLFLFLVNSCCEHFLILFISPPQKSIVFSPFLVLHVHVLNYSLESTNFSTEDSFSPQALFSLRTVCLRERVSKKLQLIYKTSINLVPKVLTVEHEHRRRRRRRRKKKKWVSACGPFRNAKDELA